MFKLILLEERPVDPEQNSHVLHSDGVNEIAMKEVSFFPRCVNVSFRYFMFRA